MKIFRSNISPRTLCIVFINSIFFSCGRSETSTNAFIGGEIVNPTANHVVISRDSQILDSIFLNSRNRFSYQIKNVSQGFYLLEHRPETQIIYVSPGDSILLRANTLAFDESLHFSGGDGHKENNFLTELFLLDEQNAEMLLSFYDIPPADFVKKVDSIEQQHLALLKSKKNFSKDFIERAKLVISYATYDLKERYSYLVNKYYKKLKKEIPEDYYDYREKADFGLDQIQATPSYRRFIDNFLVNYSLERCDESGLPENPCTNLFSHENIVARIEKADELLTLPVLRKHFLMKLGVLGIITSRTEEEISYLLNLLKENDYPSQDFEDMKQLGRVQKAYLPGTSLRAVEIVNYEGETVSFESTTDEPTIVFLWSIYSGKHEEYHQLIENLRKRYPEINFIGINMDIGESEKWRTTVRHYGYDSEKEFQLGEVRIKKEIFRYYLNKLLFIDASGKVVVGDVFINSPELENRILEFLNP